MNNLYLFFGLILVVYCFIKYNSTENKNLISIDRAIQLIRENKIDYIIDVRTKQEYKLNHYPNSINIPFNEISSKTTKNINKNSTILLYCKTGNRAKKAMNKLISLDFTNVLYIKEPLNKFSTIL